MLNEWHNHELMISDIKERSLSRFSLVWLPTRKADLSRPLPGAVGPHPLLSGFGSSRRLPVIDQYADQHSSAAKQQEAAVDRIALQPDLLRKIAFEQREELF